MKHEVEREKKKQDVKIKKDWKKKIEIISFEKIQREYNIIINGTINFVIFNNN